MKCRKILTILVLALGLMVCGARMSEAGPMGTGFTYQGRLIDSNDAAEGLYDLTFRLYESEVGETRAANDVNVGDVNVSDGYFTVELDFGNGAFDGDARWLEIGVRPGEMNDPNVYTTLGPRQEVTPTPYALQTRGIFVDDSGNVGIGTKFPDKKLTVAFGDFAVYPGPSEPSIITDGYNVKLGDPDGIRNQVFLEIDDLTEKFVFNNGNVGIGASAPDKLLSLEKQGQASSAPQIKIKGYYAGSGGGSYLVMGKSRGPTVGDNQMTASGDPLGLIDSLGINVSNNEATASRIMFKQDGMASLAYVPGRIEFYTSNGSSGPAERMRIDKDGNVGIGTTNPLSTLSVGADGELGVGVYGVAHAAGVYGQAVYMGVLGSAIQGVHGEGSSYGVYGICNDGFDLNVGVYANAGSDSSNNAYAVQGKVSRDGTGSYYSGHFTDDGTGGVYYGLYADVRTGGPIDLAEYILDTYADTEPGDVLVADPDNNESVVKANKPFDSSVVGIVSTKPHMVMGMELIMDEETGEVYEDVDAAQLSLAGRVPVKVTDENGPIQRGDMLTTSSTPGHAMKWTLLDVAQAQDFEELKSILAENETRRNAILGKALEPHESGDAKITAIVSLQ